MRSTPENRSAELQEFYRDWFLPLVRRAHWQHHLSSEDARDVVQDAFLLAIEKLDVTQNPRVWLKRVVDNLALNMARKHKRRKRLLTLWQQSDSATARVDPE